jgi:DNA-binding CsgD family transcriptional regulator
MKHELSPRQAQIMYRICAGMFPKEIAGDLAISPNTVRAHLNEAKRRLRSRTLAQAAVTFTGKSNSEVRHASEALPAPTGWGAFLSGKNK